MTFKDVKDQIFRTRITFYWCSIFEVLFFFCRHSFVHLFFEHRYWLSFSFCLDFFLSIFWLYQRCTTKVT